MESGEVIVFVNVFNRLTTTRKLCEQLAAMSGVRVVIVDNASTWGPLVDWYETDCPYQVVRLDENMGHHAPWISGVVASLVKDPFYCVTDCDLDLQGVPLDLMQVLQRPLVSCVHGLCGVKKSGISLRIDDLPEWQSEVARWEKQFWRRQRGGYFVAPIDTTLCMYPTALPQSIARTVVGPLTVRSALPYTARHVPWYLDGTDLDAENLNYFATAGRSNSWRLNGRALSSQWSGGV